MTTKRRTPDLLHDVLEQIDTWDDLPEVVDVRHLAGKDRKLIARWAYDGVSPERAREIIRQARRRAAHFNNIRRAVEALPPDEVEAYDLERWPALAHATWEEGFRFSQPEAEMFIHLWCRFAVAGRPLFSSYNPWPASVAAIAVRSDIHGWSDRDLKRLAFRQWSRKASRRALRRALRAWKHGLWISFRLATRAGGMSQRGMLAVAVATADLQGQTTWPAIWERVAEVLHTPVSRWPRESVGSPWLWLRNLYPGLSQKETRDVLRGMISLTESDVYFIETTLVREFSPRGYRQVRSFFPETPEGAAYAVLLAVVFRRRAGEFLRRMAARGVDAHDAAQILPAQTVLSHMRGRYGLVDLSHMRGGYDLVDLGRWLLAHSASAPVEALGRVVSRWPEIWDTFGEAVHSAPLQKVLSVAMGAELGYEYISLPLAGQVAKFPSHQRGASHLERRWLSSLVVPTPFPLNREWVQGNLRGRFLPRHDPRGIFLGEHTNSCQHPQGMGKSAAWHGQEHPLGGYFVVEDHRGEVVAMSWTWWTPGQGMCFDNIEAKGLDGRQDTVAAIYEMATHDLAAMGYGRVTVGIGHSDLDGASRWPTARPPLPVPTGVYTDAHSQWLLAGGAPTRRPDTSPYRVQVVWPEQVADWPFERVAQACYPQGFDFVDTENPDIYLALIHESEVVGYAAIQARQRYINDVAVLPEHRGPGSLTLINGVMQIILGVAPEDEWSADTRVKTSYRLLQLLARANRVVITADEPGEHVMDGHLMRRVRFRLQRAGA